VQINGGSFATVASGSASAALIVNYGANIIDVKVTAQDGTVKTYNITITKPFNTIDKTELTASTPAAGGYSLRLLSSAYTGPLVRITVGSSYYDVYPDATNGTFSATSKISAALFLYNAAVSAPTTNALSTIMSGISATVAIWYDQSSTNNATQSATASQPRIITAGVIETNNSLPTLKFLGNSFFLINSTDFINHLSGSIVFNATSTNTNTGSATTWYYMNGILGAERGGGTTDFGYGIYNNKFTAGFGPGDNSVASGLIINDGTSSCNNERRLKNCRRYSGNDCHWSKSDGSRRRRSIFL
jgi:Cadherin-like beta sandwich domain